MDESAERWQLWGSLALVMLVVLGAILSLSSPAGDRGIRGAEQTARALQAREGGSIRYSCKRMEKDDSLIDMSEVGFFVGTNSHQITVLRQTG